MEIKWRPRMGICEVLTIIFVMAKLMGKITWSWWIVVCPMYPALLLYLIVFGLFVLGLIGAIISNKHNF